MSCSYSLSNRPFLPFHDSIQRLKPPLRQLDRRVRTKRNPSRFFSSCRISSVSILFAVLMKSTPMRGRHLPIYQSGLAN